MARLREHGYRTVSLSEAVACLREGRTFPDRSLVITFDDGSRTVYDEAFPALRRYDMSATVFLSVGRPRGQSHQGLSSDGGPLLTWQEIREMEVCGIEFGAHTLTHPDLTRLPVERIEEEVCGSKTIIEDALGTPVTCFAYPYGRYDARSYAIVRKHFVAACSDRLGLVTSGSDPYALERVDAYYLRSDWLLGLMLTRWFPWYVRMRSVPRSVRRTVYWRPG
jgi:peptidoglycan/xylan/chitin deacetylase (PgdA/CDA1 family)